MKKLIFILLAACFSLFLAGCDNTEDTKKEKTELEKVMDMEVDYRPKDSFVEYEPELKQTNNWFDTIFQTLGLFIKYGVYILIFALIVALIILVGRQVSLAKNEKSSVAEENFDSDSIYEHNYLKEIDILAKRQDYKGAIRLLYLYTIFNLNTCKAVSWNESKTPTEYYYELQKPNLKGVFFRITSAFLEVVYGNADADQNLFEQVNTDARYIAKCVTPVIK